MAGRKTYGDYEIQEMIRECEVRIQGLTPFQWSSAASSSLPAEVQASVARAKLAIKCTQLATLCVLRCAAPTGALTESAAHAVDALQRSAFKFVQCFALTPLPLPGGRRWATVALLSLFSSPIPQSDTSGSDTSVAQSKVSACQLGPRVVLRQIEM